MEGFSPVFDQLINDCFFFLVLCTRYCCYGTARLSRLTSAILYCTSGVSTCLYADFYVSKSRNHVAMQCSSQKNF